MALAVVVVLLVVGTVISISLRPSTALGISPKLQQIGVL